MPVSTRNVSKNERNEACDSGDWIRKGNYPAMYCLGFLPNNFRKQLAK